MRNARKHQGKEEIDCTRITNESKGLKATIGGGIEKGKLRILERISRPENHCK